MERLTAKASRKLALLGKKVRAPQSDLSRCDEIPSDDPDAYLILPYPQQSRVPFGEKVKLAERVRRMGPAELQKFVAAAREHCPEAVGDRGRKVKVRLDLVCKEAFRQLVEAIQGESDDKGQREPARKKKRSAE